MAEQPDRDQKTEEATPNKIRKAREEGQLGFSTEFLGGCALAAGIFWHWGLGQYLFGTLSDSIAVRMTQFDDAIEDPRLMVGYLIQETRSVGLALVTLLGLVAVVGSVCGLLQTNFNISFKPLGFKWDKLSIKAGMSRLISTKGAVRGLFSIAKAIIILLIVYMLVRSRYEQIYLAAFGSFPELMSYMCSLLLKTAIIVAAMMFIVGVIDLAYQKWTHMQELKMSMQEIKDENKETDGDPLMKARLKRLRAEMSQKRMLSDVPDATVVITNPTHYAVAIKYERDSMEAPVVVAKGADFLAKRIIAIAKENGVEVVERKPVARFLYANVDIGKQIPVELYQAVAEVLNFVNMVRRSA